MSIPITASGAVVPVEFGIIAARRQALIRAGQPIPVSIVVPMLVDTGASHTFIDVALLTNNLALTPKNRYKFHSASTTHDAPEECDGYDVALTLGNIADQTQLRINVLEVMASTERRDHGLLGRDILRLVQLEWLGPTGMLRMGYP